MIGCSCSWTFFYILRLKVDYFMTTFTIADTKSCLYLHLSCEIFKSSVTFYVSCIFKVDQTRKRRRELEAQRLAEKIKMEKKAALEAKRQHDELLNGKTKKITLLSEKSRRIHPDLYPKKRKTWGKKKPPKKQVTLSAESVKEAAKRPENADKVKNHNL